MLESSFSIEIKKCSICGIEKEVCEKNFYAITKNRCKECMKEIDRQRYNTDSIKNRERVRRYIEKNKEKLALKRKEKRENETQEERSERLRKQRARRRMLLETFPQKQMHQHSVESAKRKKLEHNILLEDIIIPYECPILGIPLIVGSKYRHDGSPSLERIDNSKGYIRGNIVVISWKANRLKNNASIEELEKIVQFYKNLGKEVK